ncbi:PDR/VanB family oxidoreductase [Curvibacter fontanus]|jgi:vanillate O-demethylase ferredoxin subunit|nr:oxidoreductase [Burkholderiales bacterium]
MSSAELQLLVRQIRREAVGIHSYELVHPQGQALPAFTAGAHIDVHLGAGLVRQYSLSNAPSERHRYVIAVLREEQGRGGSRALHDEVAVGQLVGVSAPRNHFELRPGLRRAILLAGGIGITPLKAMAHALAEQGVAHTLHYCVRDADRVAFADELHALRSEGRAQLHLDGGKPADGLDIPALLREPEAGTHVYYCGPAGFMAACRQATAHWPEGSVHCEHFKAPEPDAAAGAVPAGSFRAQIASSGLILLVPAHQSLADALIEAGAALDTSCVSGLCGTCKVGYRSGEVEHQDHILSETEQRSCLTPCVSRGKAGDLLVLDL